MAPARSGSGERKRSLIRSLDYECVYRFRLRRLLAFLAQHHYSNTFKALAYEATLLFQAKHLQHLVRLGQLLEAINYVYHFIPAYRMPDTGALLIKFIGFINDISLYKPDGSPTSPLYADFDPYCSHYYKNDFQRRGLISAEAGGNASQGAPEHEVTVGCCAAGPGAAWCSGSGAAPGEIRD
ncbi:hypothetical protein ACP4OV_007030 [Aristida adscensionis]